MADVDGQTKAHIEKCKDADEVAGKTPPDETISVMKEGRNLYSATYYPELLRITAIHEAGHAWAYAKWNLPLRYVTVRPRTPNIAGQCMLWGPRRISKTQSEEIAAAGPIAETRHTLLSEGADEVYDFGDYLEVIMMMGGLHDGPRAENLLYARTVDEEGFIVEDPAFDLYEEIINDWAGIERVATRLVSEGTIRGRDVFEQFHQSR